MCYDMHGYGSDSVVEDAVSFMFHTSVWLILGLESAQLCFKCLYLLMKLRRPTKLLRQMEVCFFQCVVCELNEFTF